MSSNKKYLFFWEVRKKLHQIEYLITILRRVGHAKGMVAKEKSDIKEGERLAEAYGHWDDYEEVGRHEIDSKLRELIKEKRISVRGDMEKLMENEYLLREILGEEDPSKKIIVSLDYNEINFDLLVDNLIAVRGEYKSVYRRSIFNTINPLTIFIRVVNFLSSAVWELLERTFLPVRVSDKTRNVVIGALNTVFSLCFLYLTKYANNLSSLFGN